MTRLVVGIVVVDGALSGAAPNTVAVTEDSSTLGVFDGWLNVDNYVSGTSCVLHVVAAAMASEYLGLLLYCWRY